ncbi:unnamed protein product [Prorocentrum cordatum]|uniref:Secreted protein n=1 Tax=Prorocentrum cordatum TaxID=2364126 RepID=A0ABN9WBY9_9DINO|nr:unnamed protein product [Polarella glacialis]
MCSVAVVATSAMPSSSVLGALDASEKTESVESTCDDLESIGESPQTTTTPPHLAVPPRVAKKAPARGAWLPPRPRGGIALPRAVGPTLLAPSAWAATRRPRGPSRR